MSDVSRKIDLSVAISQLPRHISHTLVSTTGGSTVCLRQHIMTAAMSYAVKTHAKHMSVGQKGTDMPMTQPLINILSKRASDPSL